jgi:hypothetical protein
MNRDDRPHSQDPAAEGIGASFTLVWNAIADIVGTAATAALVGRAAKRASSRCPALSQLTIHRNRDFTPDYTLPSSWTEAAATPRAIGDFQTLLNELQDLLYQLTGAVVLRRLASLSLPLGHLNDPRVEDN